MKYKYNKERSVGYSESDKNLRISLVGAMNLAQDMMTEYFHSYGCDNYDTKNNCNAAWVVTKAKAKFYKYPNWIDSSIKCESYTTVTKGVRICLETVITDINNNILFIVVHESCPIDLETRKVRKISSVYYPDDMEVEEAKLKEPFNRLKENFDNVEFIYNQKVQPTDIDFSNHTNNVKYVKYIMNAFESDFWNDKIITDFEIHYISESRENDIISVYKSQIEEGIINIILKIEEKEIVKAQIIYKKQN